MNAPDSTPTLSVVMPTRNQAPFIRSAIDSVLAQARDLSVPMELVVADGASTDDTPRILAALAEAHPNTLRWVSEPDQGPADAVNHAVARARGSIVGWLNSDDLYTAGAAARALQVFCAQPELVMVYGEGEHVDVAGNSLGRYPTRRPDTPLGDWADGCHICQPTAFFRRETFSALGGLDLTLATAFDYEFWLRLFKAHPGQIGFVPVVQANSRLHDQGITLRMREQVAMEGLQVVHRHIGPAPAHWLMTHVGEALRACPFERDPAAVRARLAALAEQARRWMVPGGADAIARHVATHCAVQLARPDFAVDVYADGWAPPTLDLRLRQPTSPYRRLRLWGRHAAPGGRPLRLTLRDEVGRELWAGGTSRPGPFELSIPLPADAPGCCRRFTVDCDSSFVPAEVDPASGDRRALAFMVGGVELR